jgi:hypothetical protein
MVDTKYRPLTPEERERYGLFDKAEAVLDAQRQHAERQRLRDQFAAAALTGLLASMQKNVLAEDAASHAYEVADAMMAARKVK